MGRVVLGPVAQSFSAKGKELPVGQICDIASGDFAWAGLGEVKTANNGA